MATSKPVTGWMQGVIKEVPSGDTLRIASAPRMGAPEKRITLASLIAPKMGNRDGSKPDEPYAWEAKEFLRKLVIGKTCTFRVDYLLENIPGREFGSVFLSGPKTENVALRVAAEGWAKVRQGGGSQSPYIEQLTAATEHAEAQKKGVFQQGGEKASRNLSDFAAQDLLDRVGKGKPLPAIVDQIGNGANLRVTLLDGLQAATVQVCGVQCPSVGRRAVSTSEGADSTADAVPPQPFAMEAKHFSETAVLNREVRVLLQGVDKHDNLIGSVMYPSVGQEGADLIDLGQQLVERGLGKIAEWGLQMMIVGSQKLREAERKAKQSKTGIWHDYVPPASAGVKLSDDFTGIVIEVVSGDVICVKDSASGVERRVTLSSIKAPRMATRDRSGEPWAREARELLRQRLIGKEVHVNMEYSRKVGGALQNGVPAANGSSVERQMDFGSIHIKEKGDKNQHKMTNVAALLLARGMASVVKHRTDDERSAHYEALLEAEQVGIKNKSGMHKKNNNANSTSFHVNDISLPGNASKAKQHLSFLTRNKNTAVVEAVLSGNRLKLYIEKEGIMLAFSPSGVRAPQKPQPAGNGRPAVNGEPFWEEAFTFTRQHMLQREVEVEIETADRGGSFLGSIVTKGPKQVDLGLALLKNGLAKLHPSFDPSRVTGGRDLVAAEEAAQNKRLKVWQDYVPEAPRAATNGDAAEAVPSTSEQTSVVVTEMSDANTIYLQRVEEPRVQWITEQLKALDTEDSSDQAPKLKSGNLCLARFSLDKQLYRARVDAADHSDPVCPVYTVTFIDFGNRERVKATAIKAIDAGMSAVPAQAQAANLAYLKVKGLDDEAGVEAARLLAALTGNGKRLSATLVRGSFSSPSPIQVILAEEDAEVADSINAKILRAGLARFAPLRKNQVLDAAGEALQGAEQAARKGHEGMWQYGDPGDESDEEEAKPKSAWGRR